MAEIKAFAFKRMGFERVVQFLFVLECYKVRTTIIHGMVWAVWGVVYILSWDLGGCK